MFEVFSVQRGSNVDTSVNSMKSYVVGFMEGGWFESLNGWSCRSRCKAHVERSRVGTKKLPGRGLFGSQASMGIHPWPLHQHGAPSPSAPPLSPRSLAKSFSHQLPRFTPQKCPPMPWPV